MNEILIGNKQVSNNYRIPTDSQKLIVSNVARHIHPRIDFILETEKLLWKNLQEAFPDELRDPLRLSAIMAFMKRRKIAMADLTAPDSLLEAIAESAITEILFTGSFSPDSVFCQFYESVLGQTLTRTIRQQRGALLDASFFGRPVWLTVLYSATGNANVGIARSQQFQAIRHQLDENRPVHDFRLRSYREKFELPSQVNYF